MSKHFVWLGVVLILCLCLQEAFAMGGVMSVTKQNQAELGLKFTLVADKVDDQAVIVRMEIPRAGKLKTLRAVAMSIGLGQRPEVYAPLQSTSDKKDVWVVNFQVSPQMAEKCTVDLTVPNSTVGMEYTVYAVQLKGYVTESKK